MREKFLLGATKEREIVFGSLEVTYRNGYPEFTASFDTVSPFTEEDKDTEDYYETLLDDCYTDEDKYKLCERYNCKPSEIAEHLANERGRDIQDMIDCSIYPEIINVDGTDYYFESMSGGQHDTREDMVEYTNKEMYDSIHELWDKYHLCKVSDEVIVLVEKIQNELSEIDEIEWIRNYIRDNF